jgi:hypothetical protein
VSLIRFLALLVERAIKTPAVGQPRERILFCQLGKAPSSAVDPPTRLFLSSSFSDGCINPRPEIVALECLALGHKVDAAAPHTLNDDVLRAAAGNDNRRTPASCCSEAWEQPSGILVRKVEIEDDAVVPGVSTIAGLAQRLFARAHEMDVDVASLAGQSRAEKLLMIRIVLDNQNIGPKHAEASSDVLSDPFDPDRVTSSASDVPGFVS